MSTQKQVVNGAHNAPLFMAEQFAAQAKKAAKFRVTMIVTPEQAALWLKGNTRNRNIRPLVVVRYAKDMAAGRWRNVDDCIMIDPQGTIIDGQHRLSACVKSGVSFEVDVVFNADMSAQDFKDINAVRGCADVAALAGIPNAVRVAAVARLVVFHKEHGIAKFSNSNLHPTKAQVNDEALHNPRLGEAVMAGCKKITAPSVIDFCNYVFREQDPVAANIFMTDVLTRNGTVKGDPAYALSERLEENNRSKAKLRQHMIIALFFKAWKYYRDGKPLKCLRWSTGEEFPEI
jgi:hypothetical protein